MNICHPRRFIAILTTWIVCLFVCFGSLSMLTAQDHEDLETASPELNLESIEDEDWLNSEDAPAYYGLLDRANRESQPALRKAGRTFIANRLKESKLPTFVDMIRNPKEFRGKPVTLSGHVLQTLEYEAEENEYGIETLYEVALFTEDSQGHPTTVVSLEIPEELSVGGNLVDGVTVSGYFLRSYWYDSSDDRTRKAPLILAKTVTVRPTQSPTSDGNTGVMIFSAILAAVCLLIVIVAGLQRADRKRLLAEQKKRLDLESPQFPGAT